MALAIVLMMVASGIGTIVLSSDQARFDRTLGRGAERSRERARAWGGGLYEGQRDLQTVQRRVRLCFLAGGFAVLLMAIVATIGFFA